MKKIFLTIIIIAAVTVRAMATPPPIEAGGGGEFVMRVLRVDPQSSHYPPRALLQQEGGTWRIYIKGQGMGIECLSVGDQVVITQRKDGTWELNRPRTC